MMQTNLRLGQSNKRTRRRVLIKERGRVGPRSGLVALIGLYMAECRRGRLPFVVEVMLRIHFMRQWFSLSDPAMEEARHDMERFRYFPGIGNWDELVPDESTTLRFHRVREKHKLVPQILQTLNELLRAKGLILHGGTVAEATLITTQSLTKNAKDERDPEMKRSKKDKQRYFGMKAHKGVDADSIFAHTVRSTTGSVNDVTEANALLHSDETEAFGHAGNQAADKQADAKQQADDAKQQVRWHIAMRPPVPRNLVNLHRPQTAALYADTYLSVSLL